MSRRAPDGGLAFYSAIAEGQERYIDQAAREAFARHFPLSAKARTQFDRAVWEIKDAVKGYVGELVERKCQLEIGRWPVEWLVCTEVTSEDCPWIAEEKERKEREGIFGVVGAEKREERIKEAEAEKGKKKGKEGEQKASAGFENLDEGARECWEMMQRKSRRADRKLAKAAAMAAERDDEASISQNPDNSSNIANKATGSKLTEIAGLGFDDEEESDPDDDGKWGGNAFSSGSNKRKKSDNEGVSTNPRVSNNLAFGFDANKQDDHERVEDRDGSVIDVTDTLDIHAATERVIVHDDDDADTPASKRQRRRSRSEKSNDRRSRFADRNGTGGAGAGIDPAFYVEFDGKLAPESYVAAVSDEDGEEGLEDIADKLKAFNDAKDGH